MTSNRAGLEKALADAQEWYTQLKVGDDPGNADEVTRLAQERVPAVEARALRICADFGLPVSDFTVPVWDVIISWRDASWVLNRLEV